MRFWDACALTPLFVTEPRTADLRSLEASDPEIQVWWGSRVEVTSAIFKKVRGEVISPTGGALAARDVEAKFDVRYTPVAPSRPILLRATGLVKVYNLGAADALQLAAFLENGLCREFVTLDRRLHDAAFAEGATTLLSRFRPESLRSRTILCYLCYPVPAIRRHTAMECYPDRPYEGTPTLST